MSKNIDLSDSIFIQDINDKDIIKEKLNIINIEKPVKTNDIYYSNINLMFQTSKINIHNINKKVNKITLNIDNIMEKFFELFDKKIMEILVDKSSELFEDNISSEEIEDIYYSSIENSKSNVKIKLNLNKKLVIFNKSKTLLNLDDLEINDEIICLIKCSKIIYYKNYCRPYWEVLQIKHKKSKELDLKQYLIREDENDNYKSDNDNNDDILLKELKIKN